MIKKLLLGIGTAALAIALVAVAVNVAFAQTPTPPDTKPGYGPRSVGGGRTMLRGVMGNLQPGWMHTAMLNAFAEALDLDRAVLEERLAAGETMRNIALAEGLTLDEFFAVQAEARAAALGQAVEAGTLTQAQADFLATRMAQRQGFMGGRGSLPGQGGYGPGNCPFVQLTPAP